MNENEIKTLEEAVIIIEKHAPKFKMAMNSAEGHRYRNRLFRDCAEMIQEILYIAATEIQNTVVNAAPLGKTAQENEETE